MSDYPNGTYATIKVTDGASREWPVVERVGGGWQSGAHHYPDAIVEAVRPLAPLAPRPVIDREALLHHGDVLAALEQVYKDGAMGGEWPSLGADAVMELARPMPTREQIARALGRAENRDPDGKSDEYREFFYEIYGPRADAVLALLTGSES